MYTIRTSGLSDHDHSLDTIMEILKEGSVNIALEHVLTIKQRNKGLTRTYELKGEAYRRKIEPLRKRLSSHGVLEWFPPSRTH